MPDSIAPCQQRGDIHAMSGTAEPIVFDEGVWRAIAEGASDGLFVTDESLKIRWVNPRACELLGRTLDELCGCLVSDFFWDPNELDRLPLRRDVLDSGRTAVTERAFRTKDGTQRVLEVSAKRVGEGMLVGIARDATERLVARERLARSEESFRALIEGTPDGIVVHVGGVTVYANSAVATMLGHDGPSSLVGTHVLDLVHPDDRTQVLARVRALAAGEPTVPFAEERLLRRDGKVVVASIAGVNIVYEGHPAIAAIARDITDQRTREAHFAHTDKMASLGILSAGVAHEINNPLAYVTLRLRAIATVTDQLRTAVALARHQVSERFGAAAAAEILGATFEDSLLDPLDDHLATASEGVERMRTIVHDLQVFSRDDDDVRRPLDVREPLSRALSMVGHTLRDRARVVRTELATPLILASEGRLTQVFVNLLLNASHAIEGCDPKGAEVRIGVAFEEDEVRVSIEDTGNGIPPEDLSRLFQPFFTTKPAGMGTGLGLAICHGIVSSLGGTIRVASRVGEGTIFTVAIPPASREL